MATANIGTAQRSRAGVMVDRVTTQKRISLVIASLGIFALIIGVIVDLQEVRSWGLVVAVVATITFLWNKGDNFFWS